MGLDVYLKWFYDYEATQRLESEYEAKSEELWEVICEGKKYDDASDEQKALYRVKADFLKKELGLDSVGSDEANSKTIEEDSTLYPDHMFKIGYFRSSYNGGGINSVLTNFVGMDLYYIFNRNRNDEYHFQPDWADVIKRCDEVLSAFENKILEVGGLYKTFDVGMNMFESIETLGDRCNSEEDALHLFTAEITRYMTNKKSGTYRGIGSYTNSNGEFFFDKPLNIVSLVPGTKYKRPVTYVIYKEDDETLNWYRNAIEIVKETAEYVLTQPDTNKYYLAWSS
jgi:hypothetical protein